MKRFAGKHNSARNDRLPNTPARSSSSPPKNVAVDGNGTPQPAETPAQQPVAVTSMSVLAVHFVWLLIGPLILILLLLAMLQPGATWFSKIDIAYVVTVLATILARSLDQWSGQATTVDGAASTWSDFRGYCVRLLGLAVVAWGLAKYVGLYLLAG